MASGSEAVLSRLALGLTPVDPDLRQGFKRGGFHPWPCVTHIALAVNPFVSEVFEYLSRDNPLCPFPLGIPSGHIPSTDTSFHPLKGPFLNFSLPMSTYRFNGWFNVLKAAIIYFHNGHFPSSLYPSHLNGRLFC